MTFPRDEVVVIEIAGSTARLRSETKVHDAELVEVGFVRDGDDLVRAMAGKDDRVGIVRLLMDIGALFSSGKEWSPEELADLYREEGLTNRRYRVISWLSPDRYVISER